MRHYARSRAWCEWEDFGGWLALATEEVSRPLHPAAAAGAALSPFHLLSLPGISAAQQRRAATHWMAARLQDSRADRALLAREFAQASAARGPPQPGHKIRLGYLSNDFHQHATALLMVEMLEAHDHQRFELHAFSHGADDGQGMRQRLQAAFDHFHDIGPLDDLAAARAIHAQDIHLLVDLKGYTAGTRTPLLSYRPAPVQVSFLGYPGTLGGGLLHAVGLPGLVTHHLADYATLAQALVDEPSRLQALRAKLAAQRQDAPLFNVAAYTLSLEALFTAMWQRHAAGLPPGALSAG